MKKVFCFQLILLFFLQLDAQPYLNQRASFGYSNSRILSVLVDTDGYYLSGIMVDSSDLSSFQSFFMKVDFEGEPIFKTNLTSDTSGLELWGNGTFFSNDSTIITWGYWLDNSGYGLIAEFSKHGDLLRKIKVNNPARMDGRGISLSQLRQLPSGNFIFTANTNSSDGLVQILYGKMDKDFKILWYKTIKEPCNIVARNILFEDEANFFLGGYSSKDSDFDFDNRLRFFKIDTLGEVLWDFATEVSDSLTDCNDMTFDNNGNLIIACASFLEDKDTFGINTVLGFPYFKPAVIKFDTTSKKIIWGLKLKTNYNYLAPLVRVLPNQDKSEFVLGGDLRMNHHDSIENDTRGLIFKINNFGDTLWMRTFQFLTEKPRIQSFDDLEATPDGGFIAGGLSILAEFTPEDFPVIQTWLVKTDKNGCIVPNCGVSSASYIPEDGIVLNVFPNPASEQLNFYLKYHQSLKNVSCRLINGSGHEIKRHSKLANDNTFILPIEGIDSGVYFLQIVSENEILKTEKVVVAH